VNLRTYLISAVLSLATTAVAWGFDYARYQATDLDNVIEMGRPKSGADIYPGRPLKITVALMSYPEPCNATFLKKSMIMIGVPKDQVDAAQITSCIKVRSAKGKVQSLFIQDRVAAFLPKEVRPGSYVTLFAIDMYANPDGLGLLVNEFSPGGSP
jgi:hypothetical protein